MPTPLPGLADFLTTGEAPSSGVASRPAPQFQGSDTLQPSQGALGSRIGEVAPPPQFLPGPSGESARPTQDLFTGTIDSLTQGITFGFGDELSAFEAALLGRPPGGGLLDVGNFEGGFFSGFDDRRQAALEAERAQQAVFAEQNPLLDFGAEVAVAAAVPGAAARLPGAVGRAAQAGNAFFTGGSNPLSRVGRAALGGAAGGAAFGIGEGNSSDFEGAVDDAQTGAAFGAAGGVVGQQIGRALSRLFGGDDAQRFFTDSRLNEAGRQALRDAGIDPDTVSSRVEQAFAEQIRRAGGVPDNPLAAGRIAQAAEFDIPLTQGQATGDIGQLSFEQAARNQDSRGAAAGRAIREIEEQQQGAVRGTIDRLAGGVETPLGAAEAAGEGVRTARDAAQRSVDDAFSRARDADAVIDVNAFPKLAERARSALDEVTFNPASQTRSALTEIESLVKRATGEPGAVGVDFAAVERLRQRLNRIGRTLFQSDRQASVEVNTIKTALDEWLDDTMDSALIRGSHDALDRMKEARGKFREFKQTFFRRATDDDAGKLLERMAKQDVTPQELSNWLFGASKIGAKGVSVRLASRLKEVLPNETMDQIRGGVIRKIAEGDPGPQKLASRIEQFTTGDGSALARELFTADQRETIKRFGEAVRIMVPPPEATNPSKTAFAIGNMMQNTFRNLVTALGFGTGGIAGGLGARLSAAAGEAALDTARAARIPARVGRARQQTRQQPGPIAGGAAGGANIVGQERDGQGGQAAPRVVSVAEAAAIPAGQGRAIPGLADFLGGAPGRSGRTPGVGETRGTAAPDGRPDASGGFDDAFDRVLEFEGGFSDDPRDPGGRTKLGVIQPTFDGFRRKQGLPPKDVADITKDEVRELFLSEFWEPIQAGAMPPGVGFAVFDFAINSAPRNAVRTLQRVLGVTPDGVVGPETLGAINGADPEELIRDLSEARQDFVSQTEAFQSFERGLTNRVNKARRAALEVQRGTA